MFAFSRSQAFCCLEVKRRLVCVCFSGSVCVCQHRRLSRGDGRPPADSQRANYGIIRRERGHMCGAAATPTTHTRYGVLMLEGVSFQKRGVPKVPRARPHTYRIPLRRCWGGGETISSRWSSLTKPAAPQSINTRRETVIEPPVGSIYHRPVRSRCGPGVRHQTLTTGSGERRGRPHMHVACTLFQFAIISPHTARALTGGNRGLCSGSAALNLLWHLNS